MNIYHATPFEAACYRKVTWRLMPFLFLCFIMAYVDRVNVGFAKLQMQQDLGMSDSVYGVGAGIFFIGYFFFEIPGNLIMQRVGARRWIGPIMMVWGVVSSSMLLVRTTHAFYVLRFLLGLVESGFFPAVILYLTFWFSGHYRARMVAVFMSAIPLSGVLASPISGWIMANMTGVAHLAAWQWLFLLEGIPSFIMGLVTLYFLTDHPSSAKWLNDAERGLLLGQLAEEEEAKRKSGHGEHNFGDAFRSFEVWLLAVVYLGLACTNYGIGFWLPQLIKEGITPDPQAIGWISVIPWGISAVAMVLVGRHSDITGERRWHFAISGFLVGIGFAASAVPAISGPVRLAALTLATAGTLSSIAVFWAIPTAILSGTAAAAGIALINSVGNLGGYVSPFVVGKIRDGTHSMMWAMLWLSSVALGVAAIELFVTRKERGL
jgi:D-galactonate transporter